MAYGIDLRERVIFHIHAGVSISETALQFGISENTVRKWIKRFDQDGTLFPKKCGSPGKPKISKEDVMKVVNEHQDAVLIKNSI